MPHRHRIDSPETFHLRRPLLDVLHPGLCEVVGDHLEVKFPLGDLSPHERAIVEFVINPAITAQNIFSGLDREAQKALATAIYAIYAK